MDRSNTYLKRQKEHDQKLNSSKINLYQNQSAKSKNRKDAIQAMHNT
jgi:hypothetical protein